MFSVRPLTRAALVVLLGAAVASCSGGGSPAAGTSTSPAPQMSTTVAAQPPAPPAAPSPKSDEEQIRDVIQAEQDAYNTSNWEAYRSFVCEHMRAEFSGPGEASMQQARNQTGLLNVIVGTITVHGDEASAVVTQRQERGTPPNTGSFRLVREADGWKICVR